MDNDPNGDLEQLDDLIFLAAGAGICFVLALFCVMTPFFVRSDIVSSVLLAGFFATAFATFFLAQRAYRIERQVRNRIEAPREVI